MKKILWMVPCMALALASCSNDDEATNPAESRSALNISVQTENAVNSRGLITTAYLAEGSEIGLTLVDASGTKYDEETFSNLQYKATGADAAQTWGPAENVTAPTLSSTAGTVIAYYPYSSTSTDYTAVPVSVAETSAAAQIDYMYGKVADIKNSNPSAAITLNHALSAIRVTIKGVDYTGLTEIESVKVQSTAAFGSAGTLNASTGELSGISGQADGITFSGLADDMPVNADPIAYDFIVVPDVTAADFDLVVAANIGGADYSVTLDVADELVQGNIYTVNLTLANTGFTVESVGVTPWTTLGSQSGSLAPAN